MLPEGSSPELGGSAFTRGLTHWPTSRIGLLQNPKGSLLQAIVLIPPESRATLSMSGKSRYPPGTPIVRVL
jgi:hypothetical protein